MAVKKGKVYTIIRVIVIWIVLFVSCIGAKGQTVVDLKPTVTMKEYVDMQASLNKEWMQKLNDVEFNNIQDNVAKANAAMEKRLDGINEFRAQLKDQAGTFVTRDALWGYLIAAISITFMFLNYLQRKKEYVTEQPNQKVTGEIQINKK